MPDTWLMITTSGMLLCIRESPMTLHYLNNYTNKIIVCLGVNYAKEEFRRRRAQRQQAGESFRLVRLTSVILPTQTHAKL